MAEGRRAGLVCALVGAALALTSRDAWPESLEIGGTTHASSCEVEAWSLLAKELRDAAGKRDPAGIEALVQAYLCGGDGRAAEILLHAAPARLVSTDEGTGEPTTRRRVPSREALEPRGGQAWHATVHADRRDVSVTFFVNEACVRSITLRSAKATWRIRAVGNACD